MVRVFVTEERVYWIHICDRILEMGHEVVCFDNLETVSKTTLRNFKSFRFHLSKEILEIQNYWIYLRLYAYLPSGALGSVQINPRPP